MQETAHMDFPTMTPSLYVWARAATIKGREVFFIAVIFIVTTFNEVPKVWEKYNQVGDS